HQSGVRTTRDAQLRTQNSKLRTWNCRGHEAQSPLLVLLDRRASPPHRTVASADPIFEVIVVVSREEMAALAHSFDEACALKLREVDDRPVRGAETLLEIIHS